jgi:hypothetical protein
MGIENGERFVIWRCPECGSTTTSKAFPLCHHRTRREDGQMDGVSQSFERVRIEVEPAAVAQGLRDALREAIGWTYGEGEPTPERRDELSALSQPPESKSG